VTAAANLPRPARKGLPVGATQLARSHAHAPRTLSPDPTCRRSAPRTPCAEVSLSLTPHPHRSALSSPPPFLLPRAGPTLLRPRYTRCPWTSNSASPTSQPHPALSFQKRHHPSHIAQPPGCDPLFLRSLIPAAISAEITPGHNCPRSRHPLLSSPAALRLHILLPRH